MAAKRAGGRRALAMRRADLRIGGIREGNLYFLQAPFFIYKKAARSCVKPGWHGAEAVLYYGYNEGEKRVDWLRRPEQMRKRALR